jgi:predicted DNA-binding transcriptional regulator AlpA
MARMTDEPLLRTAAAAAKIGVDASTLYRWERAGYVRPTLHTAGGQARWRLSELREQLADRERAGRPAAQPPTVPPLQQLRRRADGWPADEFPGD